MGVVGEVSGEVGHLLVHQVVVFEDPHGGVVEGEIGGEGGGQVQGHLMGAMQAVPAIRPFSLNKLLAIFCQQTIGHFLSTNYWPFSVNKLLAIFCQQTIGHFLSTNY